MAHSENNLVLQSKKTSGRQYVFASLSIQHGQAGPFKVVGIEGFWLAKFFSCVEIELRPTLCVSGPLCVKKKTSHSPESTARDRGDAEIGETQRAAEKRNRPFSPRTLRKSTYSAKKRRQTPPVFSRTHEGTKPSGFALIRDGDGTAFRMGCSIFGNER